MINNIEEVIKHYEEEAEEWDEMGNWNYDDYCLECAKEYRQVATWLKCLKQIWNSGDCNDCRNGQCEWKPKVGELVRFNCPHYVGVTNEGVNADVNT